MKETKERGITLIVLIITIIIMLILVAVTISIMLGENGIVQKVKEATTRMQIEADREELQSAVLGTMENDGKIYLTNVIANLDIDKSDGEYWENSPQDSSIFTKYHKKGNFHAFTVTIYSNAEFIITYINSNENSNSGGESNSDALEATAVFGTVSASNAIANVVFWQTNTAYMVAAAGNELTSITFNHRTTSGTIKVYGYSQSLDKTASASDLITAATTANNNKVLLFTVTPRETGSQTYLLDGTDANIVINGNTPITCPMSLGFEGEAVSWSGDGGENTGGYITFCSTIPGGNQTNHTLCVSLTYLTERTVNAALVADYHTSNTTLPLNAEAKPSYASFVNYSDYTYFEGKTITSVRFKPYKAGTLTVGLIQMSNWSSSNAKTNQTTITVRSGDVGVVTEYPLNIACPIGYAPYVMETTDTATFYYSEGGGNGFNNYVGRDTTPGASSPCNLGVDFGCSTVTVNNSQLSTILNGKNFSILGDSISTYTGYSNDATNTNNTIGNNQIFYTGSNGGITSVDYTWWKQLVDETGMNLLVNNSSSGAKVVGVGNVSGNTSDQGIGIRPQNLHDNTGTNAGTNPDIIAVYMGINDLNANYTSGSYETINFNTLITNNGGTYSYAAPSNFAEGYAIMLHKIKVAYPNADVFVMNMPLRASSASQNLTAYNDIIQKLTTHYNMNLVSLYDSPISGTAYSSYSIGDNLHPNQAGMDIMTETFITALENKYLD